MFALILLIPFGSLVAAIFATAAAPHFSRNRRYLAQVPLDVSEEGASAGDAYRGPAFTTRWAEESVSHATASLPRETLLAAACLRFAVCLAGLLVVPVLFGGLFETVQAFEGRSTPGAVAVLGLSGLVLAAAQLVARRQLLTASPRSAGIAVFVGSWTILHNLVVLGCVFAGPHSDTWSVVGPDGAGTVFFGYALLSITLGVILLRAAAPQRRWLRANDGSDDVGTEAKPLREAAAG